MAWTSVAAIYFIVWWLVLFITLPWGVRTTAEAGEELVDGQAASAPVKPMLVRKALATTLISAVIVGVIYSLVEYEVIDLRKFLTGK